MDRLNQLIELIKRLSVEGIIITNFSNIFYYSKFTSEDAILYITKNKAYLITDSRYTLQAKKQAKNFEIIIRNGAYADELSKLIKGEKVLFEDSLSYSMYKSFETKLDCYLSAVNVDYLRNIKDEEEIRLIKKACNIASKTYKHILNYIKVGMKETEIENEMISYMKKLGASKESFNLIVASGKRGALPHGEASDKRIKEGDFITLDYGCIYRGYCSDITRTLVVGNVNNELKKIYNVVKEAQKRAIRGIKAGVSAKEIDKIARDYIVSKGYGKYFTHSTGHGVGIEVHDPIAISSKSNDILEENMIITVEPGIYIKNLGGVRIEDDILVKKDGYEVLTKASKKLIKINPNK